MRRKEEGDGGLDMSEALVLVPCFVAAAEEPGVEVLILPWVFAVLLLVLVLKVSSSRRGFLVPDGGSWVLVVSFRLRFEVLLVDAAAVPFAGEGFVAVAAPAAWFVLSWACSCFQLEERLLWFMATSHCVLHVQSCAA